MKNTFENKLTRQGACLAVAMSLLTSFFAQLCYSRGLSHPITTTNSHTAAPSLSLRANGKIAFTSDRDGNAEIYVMNSDGTNQTRLTNNPAPDVNPAWSPDGGRIAFVSTRDRNAEIYVMNADGSNQTRITNDFGSDETPAWSPDGTKIAFTHNGWSIQIMNADGSNVTTIVGGREPAWSRDGSKIAFTLGWDLYVTNVDGSNAINITNSLELDGEPSWSPDGSKIVFSSTYDPWDYGSQVYLMNAAGGSQRTMISSWEAWGPSWSPDGSRIAYAGYDSRNAEIYLVDPAGSNRTKLTNNPSSNNTEPDWQPLSINPIHDTSFFVRQHYLDFLNREPDAPGLAHWTGEITECNDPAMRHPGESQDLCIERKRANTSAAFFLSPEFQNTGSFILRVYWGTLGKLLNAQCPGVPNNLLGHCRPKYSEYIADMATITQGIVVNDHLDPARINANKQAFVNAFVQRIDFQAAYPANMTNPQFVDKLFQTIGISPSSGDREALIDELNANASNARASVVFKVVDGTTTITDGHLQFNTTYGQAFYNQEFDTAFVMMEYLGYLRRNPDQDGYDFWLAKMRRHGNWVDAQMVLAFIISPEYRSRFDGCAAACCGCWDY